MCSCNGKIVVSLLGDNDAVVVCDYSRYMVLIKITLHKALRYIVVKTPKKTSDDCNLKQYVNRSCLEQCTVKRIMLPLEVLSKPSE